MAQPLNVTGGAQIGWMNATWPLAQLSSTSDELTVTAYLLGTYTFRPDQVSQVEKFVMIPLLGWGVRIRHCVSDYPQRIIFWCLASPDRLLRRIRESGFVPSASRSLTIEGRGIPVRWSVIITTVAVWNAFFLLDFSRSRGPSPTPGLFACIALLLLFTLSVATLRSPSVQRLVLKPGRSVGEIRAVLRLLAFISGIMLVAFSIFLLAASSH